METEENGTPTLTEEQQEETTEETQETEEESVEDLKARLAKAEEERENQKKRAEKAEKLAKQNKPTAPAEGLSTSDVLYLAKTDVHEEDVEYLTTLAKNNKLSLKEAHAQFKPLLDVRNEERKTAQATQTGSGRGKKPATGDEYLRKAEETGEVPTSDKGMQELILARQNRFKRK